MSAQIVLLIRILIAVFIYGFLGIAIYTLWKITFPSTGKNKEPLPEITFTDNQTDQSISFTENEIYIGRDKNVNYSIIDDAASNLHARVFLKNKQWWIEDLNSTNGTFLNEEKLVSPSRLFTDDHVQCGKTKINIVFDGQ